MLNPESIPSTVDSKQPNNAYAQNEDFKHSSVLSKSYFSTQKETNLPTLKNNSAAPSEGGYSNGSTMKGR